MYICPDCEGHKVFSYAGKIIAKTCSKCAGLTRTALTGADRIKPAIVSDIDEIVRRVFEGRR